MNDQDLSRDLSVAFEYCYLHEEWVCPLREALAGLTAEAALWRPNPSAKTIWEIVMHMAVWNENIVGRIETGKNVHPPEGAWPRLPEARDEAAWAAARQRLWASLDSVRALLQEGSIEKIVRSPYGIPDLLCRYVHVGYHIGQIVKLRECMPVA